MPLFGRSPGPVPTAPAEHAPYDPSPIAEGEDECAGWDADLETLRERLNEATTTMGQQINTLQWSGHTTAPPLDGHSRRSSPSRARAIARANFV